MFLGQADKRISEFKKKIFGNDFTRSQIKFDNSNTGPQIDPESSSGQRFGADSRFNTRSQIESGTLNFTKSKIRGFTLIELLVVISIIALLSTIVLGAVNDAREKAQVKKKNEIARQYINALELYRDDHGSYPETPENTPVCLGFYENSETEECSPFGSIGNEDVDNNLVAYYSSMPTNIDYVVLWAGEYEFKGIMYLCDSNYCYTRWYIPENNDCIYGIEASDSFSGLTQCTNYLN